MSKSGSRYGRRSNWFKIHCLLQEQQQQAMQGNAFPAINVLRPHPYLPLFRNPQIVDTKSSESDSGASSADMDDELRSASAMSCFRTNASPFSDRDSIKKLPSPSSDSECITRRKLSASITLTLPASPASMPSISPNTRWLPPLSGMVDPSSWRDLWIKGPKVADVEPLSQEQPIDLSIKTTQVDHSDSEHELSIDVGVEETMKPVPLDLSLETKRDNPVPLTS